MIPVDLVARLRLLNEASFFNVDPPVAGLQRAREIQSQLPELVPGQRFFATLQRTLPDGTFRALVAGQQVTLSLNTAAKAGDTLELIVAQTTPKAVFARLANPEAAAQANSSAPSTLSQAGKLISFLLTGQPPPKPTVLANNQPLVSSPPTTGAALAPALRQALAQSGLFYESHQAQWLSGKTDLAALQREPQGAAPLARLAMQIAGQAAQPGGAAAQASGLAAQSGGTALPATSPAAQSASEAAQIAGRPGPATVGGNPALTANAALGSTASSASLAAAAGAADGEPVRGGALNSGAETAAARPAAVSERALPLVHQQLDALATNQYVWNGMAWPGQKIEWVIEDPRDEREGEDGNTPDDWNTTLRLSLPRLGGMEAQLHLTPAGVALRLRADEPATMAALEAGRADLEAALAATEVPLTGMVVELRDGSG
ncbi:MAG: flagellar hook-length control protein FliK [Betaproteobacteria bacterium HGW-Betaproteobacteria-21]|nr:MAG: flagellar hook-length control protein FliK [Betaproteobacteria bacterium HGW-Betaproteobacteria-21]